jgi:hypothetical protein
LVFVNGISCLDPNNLTYKTISRQRKSFQIYHEILLKIKELLCENATATKRGKARESSLTRDIYYGNVPLFKTQTNVDNAVEGQEDEGSHE